MAGAASGPADRAGARSGAWHSLCLASDRDGRPGRASPAAASPPGLDDEVIRDTGVEGLFRAR